MLPFEAFRVRHALNGLQEDLWHAFTWDDTPQGQNFWQAIAEGRAPLCDRARGFLHGLLYASKNSVDVAPRRCEEALEGNRRALSSAFTWAYVQADLGQSIGHWADRCAGHTGLTVLDIGFLEGCIAGHKAETKRPTTAEDFAVSMPEEERSPSPAFRCPIPEAKVVPALTAPNVTRHYTKASSGGRVRGYEVISKLIEARKAEGYELLGRASRSAALMHPERPDEVLRIGFYDYRSPAEHGSDPVDGWLFYFDQMISQTDDVYAPKVHKVDLFPEHYEVRMERLFEANDENKRDLSECTYGYRDRAKDKGFADYLDKVRAVWRKLEAAGAYGGLDLHPGNIMRRRDGQIVLTDPFCLFA